MLANLSYIISDDMVQSRGMYLEKVPYDSDGIKGTLYESRFDRKHPFWEKANLTEEDSNRLFCAVQTPTPGILAGYGIDKVINFMTDYEVIKSLQYINTNNGEFYNSDDFLAMCSASYESELLPSGRPFPLSTHCNSPYGVADNLQQILKKHKNVLTSEMEVVIGFHPVYKEDQPEHGGWRWHKHGTYIGTHKKKHEYLYDEEGIDVVYCYELIPVKKKETL
ncbi:hypothetical protein FOI42_RS02770 [Escherichia coli]|nr:hypothetical protein [Escherichia coli]EFL4883459.1 hypothetical protein [Escherichia coli]MED6699226.1 hypothetical protein [Escherichia coli O157]HCQ0858758.1 hypothetical protein [Escherichia coli]